MSRNLPHGELFQGHQSNYPVGPTFLLDLITSQQLVPGVLRRIPALQRDMHIRFEKTSRVHDVSRASSVVELHRAFDRVTGT